MTSEEKAALREAASKATPGPWFLREKHRTMLPHISTRPDRPDLIVAFAVSNSKDIHYIALAHPAAVLALLDECEKLRGALDAAHSAICRQLVDYGDRTGSLWIAAENARAALGDGA